MYFEMDEVVHFFNKYNLGISSRNYFRGWCIQLTWRGRQMIANNLKKLAILFAFIYGKPRRENEDFNLT